jgi:hypothetical protein
MKVIIVVVKFNKNTPIYVSFFITITKKSLFCVVITFLGSPRTAIEGKIVVGRLWPVDVLEHFIYGLYPSQPLQLVGFKYAHFDKQKRIKVHDHIVSVRQLAVDIGKGRLLIIPNRDLPQALVDIDSLPHMVSSVFVVWIYY